MANTLAEVRKAAMELSEEDREVLAEELIISRWSPKWREAWGAEAERRYARVLSGEDRTYTIEEFFSDDEE